MTEPVMTLHALKVLSKHASLKGNPIASILFRARASIELFDSHYDAGVYQPIDETFLGVIGRLVVDGQAAQLRLGNDGAVYLNAESRRHIFNAIKDLVMKAYPAFCFCQHDNGKTLATTSEIQPTAEGTSMKENNAAAILREDTYTVHVAFNVGEKSYTYVSNIAGLSEGDQVIVPANGDDKFSLATVVGVDSELNIEPGSSTRFRFVAAKVDLTAYTKLLEENAAINKALAENYRNSARQQFRNMMLQDNPMLAALTTKKVG